MSERPATAAAAAVAGDETTVEWVDSEVGLDALQPDWERCLERSPGASIFVSFEWQRAWWRHYGGGRALRIVVARRAGRVTGILPLYVGTAPLVLGVPARVLRLVGSGSDTSPDYLGPVVDSDGMDATLETLCRAAARSAGWDAVDLTDVAEPSPFLPRFEDACRAAGMAPRRTRGAGILVVRLPGSWPEYVASMSREDRSKYARRPRRLWEKAGGRFFTWQADPPLDRVVDRLAELHRMRWQGRTERHAFSTPEYVSFHRDVMHALAERGRLRLYCVAMGDAIAGVYYCYAFGGEVSHFQVGFDPQYHSMAPGHALMAYAVEQAIGEGARVFDMLKGEYPHKAVWANDRRSTVGLRAYRSGLRGRLLQARREWAARLRRSAPPPPGRATGSA